MLTQSTTMDHFRIILRFEGPVYTFLSISLLIFTEIVVLPKSRR